MMGMYRTNFNYMYTCMCVYVHVHLHVLVAACNVTVVPNSVHPPMIVVGTDDPSTSASTQLLIFGYSDETRYIYTCTCKRIIYRVHVLSIYMYIVYSDGHGP